MPADSQKRVPLDFPAFQTVSFFGALEGPEVEESSVW